MKSIEILGGVLFVRDDKSSDKYFETYRAEANLNRYRLKIDKTIISQPYYELFRDFEDNGRPLTERLTASSHIDVIANYCKNL